MKKITLAELEQESEDKGMTINEIIQGLQFTIDMFLLNPTTGEVYTEPRNDMDKTTIEACKGAIKELQDNSYELWKESYEVEHERNIRLEEKIKALEQEPCEDAVSRKAVVEYIEGSDAELGHSSENELVCQDILNMPSVKPVACIATIKFSKEDLRDICNEHIEIGCTHGTCKDCFYYNIGFDSAEEINKTAEGDERT